MRIDNGLLRYFDDHPYNNCISCCTLIIPANQEYMNKNKEHLRQLNESFKRLLIIVDKRQLTMFQIANYKTRINNYFEQKHKSCIHPKLSYYDKVKRQWMTLFG